MVLIAAAVCTKAGKTIVSRQFVEMTKARIEGLLAAFPKLMTSGSGKQHTFVETDSVRYVYQPIEKLYMLLITTKASNILEDLETLRLFSRVIPEYCRTLEEKEIVDNAFLLLFAFDEIVALGYRESVNLAQIRTFVEMDSHEEKVYQAVRQTQEREAKNKMREKAKELQRQRMEANKRGGPRASDSGGFGGGNAAGSMSNSSTNSNVVSSSVVNDVKPSYTQPQKPQSRNALKLGGKSRDVDSFVDQLKSEGQLVTGPNAASVPGHQNKILEKAENTDDVHLRLEDRLTVRMGRDGGLQALELSGLLTLRISDDKYGRIKVQLNNSDARGVQLQTHPNVDKELFKAQGQIGLKNPAKPFPLHNDIGVLKWRLQSQDAAAVPLSINCWPSENGDGGCDVNIEYELEHQKLELQDVTITIPLPLGISPSITEFDGEYSHDARRNLLVWSLPLIDINNRAGSMEFACPASIPGDFFPLNVSFTSTTPYADLSAEGVVTVDGDQPVKYSLEKLFIADKYEIV